MKTILSLLLAFFFSSAFAINIVDGIVYANNGEKIPFANVALKSGSNIIELGVTDFDGYFQIKTEQEGMFHLEASFIGFQTATSNEFLLSDEIPLTKNFELERGIAIEEVVITCEKTPLIETSCRFYCRVSTYCTFRFTEEKKVDQQTKETKKESLVDFTIHPNPSNGANITLMTKNFDLNKNNILNVFNMSGQLIYSKQFQQIEKQKQLFLNDLINTPGNYFITIVNGESLVTKKLVIQN